MPKRRVGTGGLASEAFLKDLHGYAPVEVVWSSSPVEELPYAKLMAEVRTGFGRTLSRLTEVFGVSRQTLYNWLDGETPKEEHRERLRQLSNAAQVFAELQVKPTSQMLDRTVSDGKSILQLLAEGAAGKETAQKLIRIHQRGQSSRAQLDELLAGRAKSRPDASDLGAESFDEKA
jgi:transcriptional regulator with XRE-family HTH domain